MYFQIFFWESKPSWPQKYILKCFPTHKCQFPQKNTHGVHLSAFLPQFLPHIPFSSHFKPNRVHKGPQQPTRAHIFYKLACKKKVIYMVASAAFKIITINKYLPQNNCIALFRYHSFSSFMILTICILNM